jgi:hypothetical protein
MIFGASLTWPESTPLPSSIPQHTISPSVVVAQTWSQLALIEV